MKKVEIAALQVNLFLMLVTETFPRTLIGCHFLRKPGRHHGTVRMPGAWVQIPPGSRVSELEKSLLLPEPLINMDLTQPVAQVGWVKSR